VALVLGSGMGEVARRLQAVASASFAEVPGLAVPSVAGHQGKICLGHWGGQRALVFLGRLHHYEGYPWPCVVGPVHVAHALGARILVLTNAAGGIHDALGPGSFMAIHDHVEWTRPACWKQPGPGALGPARPSPYSARIRGLLQEAARTLGMELPEGIYASVTGPSYETPAEIRALKQWGADAVGMSTAREIQTGYELGLECAALSCITNRAAGLAAGAIHHGEVLTTATTQIPRLGELVEGFLQRL
jgi:purine-nucleoside phosphorylase